MVINNMGELKMQYSDEYLINRFIEKFEGKSREAKKFRPKNPKIIHQNRKTIFCNFSECCESICRDPIDLQKYLRASLGIVSSISQNKSILQKKKTLLSNLIDNDESNDIIDEEIIKDNSDDRGSLIFDNRCNENEIKKHYIAYIKEFVMCKEGTCGSGSTEIVKDNRVIYLVCKSCNSKRAISGL